MTALLIRWTLALLHWLAPEARYLIVGNDDLLKLARLLTQAQESFPDRSGEAKRHQVYAALIKSFPNRSKREIALAIEAALGA